MSKYDQEYFADKKFEPEAENDGGIKSTSGERDESKKIRDLYTPSPSKERNDKDQGGLRRVMVGRKLRAKSSVITLGMLLFGGGGFMTVFFTPTFALNQFTTLMTQKLNDQFYAVEQRSDLLLQAKLSEVTKGSCGLIKIACRFGSMSDTQVERFKKAGIEVERKDGFLIKSRGQITKMSFKGSDGQTVTIKKAEELHRMSLENIEFRSAKTTAFNPFFATLNPTEKIVKSVLKRLKARAMPVTGETDEERKKNLNSAIGGETAGNGKPLVELDDEDGKKKYSSGGQDLTDQQGDGAKEISSKIDEVKEGGGYKSFVKGVTHGISAIGYLQSACSALTFADVASDAIQIERGAQAVRFAMTGPLSTESAMRAGEAKEGDVNFVLTQGNTPTPDSETVDESKLSQGGDINNLPTTKSSSAGKTMFDSKGYRYVDNGDIPNSMSIEESQFMLGAGTPTTLTSAITNVAEVVSPDDPTPKGVRSKCRTVNHPLVTIASLGVGIVLGVGSFGLTTVAGISASVAFSMLTPYFISQIADTFSGETFKNLIGKNFGEGTYVGAGYFLSKIAQARGGKPLNKQEGAKYLQKNVAATAAYDDTQRYIARSSPFDINNRYSFLGSLAFSMVPAIEKSKTNASVAMMNVANIVPSALSLISPVTKAASVTEDYFSCNDQRIISAGANGDFFCIVHYGETESGMAKKPVQTAQWMAQTGNIDPDSENGDPKDNGKSWNYTKFLDECVNRTRGLGVADDNDKADGSNCTDPAKESDNEYFRAYTMYRSINDAMDSKPQATIDSDEAYTDGQSGDVTAGWSFPTKSDAVVSEEFGKGSGREKNGITITASNPADTEGMPIFAVYDGTVVAAGSDSELDNRIILNHWVNGQPVSTVYGHLGKNSIAAGIKPGVTVKAGQQIGVITAADGKSAGLYFEMWEGPTTTGQQVDPMKTLSVTRKAKEITNV